MLLAWHIVGLDFHILVIKGDVQVSDVSSGLTCIIGETHHAEKNVHFEISAIFIVLAGSKASDVIVVGFGFNLDGEGLLLWL